MKIENENEENDLRKERKWNDVGEIVLSTTKHYYFASKVKVIVQISAFLFSHITFFLVYERVVVVWVF